MASCDPGTLMVEASCMRCMPTGSLMAIKTYLLCQLAVLDPDAQAYIVAAGITDQGHQLAVSSFVSALKLSGLWNKSDVIYPFYTGVGSKTPSDSAAQPLKGGHVITWLSVPATLHLTFSNGVTGDGTVTAGGDTNWSMTSGPNYQTNSAHLLFYCANNPGDANTARFCGTNEFGASSSKSYLERNTVAGTYMGQCNNDPVNYGSVFVSAKGFWFVNRNSATDYIIAHDAVIEPPSATASKFVPHGHCGILICLDQTNSRSGLTTKAQAQFFSAGGALTTSEYATYRALVTDLNADWGR